jgi:hypothetical protein
VTLIEATRRAKQRDVPNSAKKQKKEKKEKKIKAAFSAQPRLL